MVTGELSLIRVFCVFQRCFLRGSFGREQGEAGTNVRGQDYRQEGAQGQGRLSGERNQSPQEVSALSRRR